MATQSTTAVPILSRIWNWPTTTQLKGTDGNASYKGVQNLRDMLADFAQRVSNAMTAYNLSGTLAQLPVAGQVARQFFALDTQTLYEDNGTVWVPIAGSAPFSVLLSTLSVTATPLNNLYLMNTTSGNLTVTLPAPTGSEFTLTVKRLSASHTLNLLPNTATDTIDGSTFAGGFAVTTFVTLIDFGTGTWATI